jgi:hypothetical protein
LRGYVAGTVALLRVDPTSASAAFTILREGELWTPIFPHQRGFLRYKVNERLHLVLVDLTWL